MAITSNNNASVMGVSRQKANAVKTDDNREIKDVASEAKDILSGLKVYEGEVESGVDKTYQLVMQGLASFREKCWNCRQTRQHSSPRAAASTT